MGSLASVSPYGSKALVGACGWRREEAAGFVTLEAYCGARRREFPGEWRAEFEANAKVLLGRVNALIGELEGRLEVQWVVSSGWRPPSVNAAIGGAPRSRHMTAEAIDFLDPGHVLGSFLEANSGLLVRHQLAMEDLRWCVKRSALGEVVRWCHLQSVIPRSGRVVFQPFPGEPPVV